jgi:hypothetical protein
MKIFISYASEDKDLAEKVHFALLGGKHETFFDKDSLPPGGSYRQRIAEEIDASDAMVFLISPDSIAEGSYSRTELKRARKLWPHPRGRVLPVMARKVEWSDVPNYLGAVTVLEPEGDTPTEVVMAISNFIVDDRDDFQQYDDGQNGGPGDSTRPRPTVVFDFIQHFHNLTLPGIQGQSMGMQIVASARVLNANGSQVQIVSKFMHGNGQPLFCHPQEPVFRDPGGLVATGTLPITAYSDEASLPNQIMAIPYYVLNFHPTNGMIRHDLQFTVMAYVDNDFIGQSAPQSFFIQW